MRLVSVADVAKALGFDPGVQTDVIGGAIDTATQQLRSRLRTDFDETTVTDTFSILPSGSLPLGSVYRTRLALSRGFLQGGITLTWSTTYADLLAAPIAEDSSFNTVLDAEKGGVVITGPDLRGTFLQVAYTAGFAPGATADDPLVGVPEWLKDLAILETIKALDITAPTLRWDDKTKPDIPAAERQIALAAASKVRYFPSGSHPIG